MNRFTLFIILALFITGIFLAGNYLYKNVGEFISSYEDIEYLDELNEMALFEKTHLEIAEINEKNLETLKMLGDDLKSPENAILSLTECDTEVITEYIEVPVVEYQEICSFPENEQLRKDLQNKERELQLYIETANNWRFRYCADLPKDNHCN